MPTTLKWKWPTKMYGSIHTRSRDLGINRCKTQEKDGGGEEARVESNVHDKEVKQSTTTKVDACNKEVKQSTMTDNEGHVDLKGVPWEEILTSNTENTSMGIVVNSNVRVYHESGQNQKHAVWSLKHLDVSMHLKNGIQRVVNTDIRSEPWKGKHGMRKDDRRKFDEQ